MKWVLYRSGNDRTTERARWPVREEKGTARGRRCEQVSPPEKELWEELGTARGGLSIRVWLFKAPPVVLFGKEGWAAYQG